MAIAPYRHPITLSQADYWALVAENEQPASTSDELDVTWQYPTQLGHGFVREIDLREGLVLEIANYQVHSDIITYSADRKHPLEYRFDIPTPNRHLSETIYHFYGSGIARGERGKQDANQRDQWVSVHMEPNVFRSFARHLDEEIPAALQHLIRRDQEYYVRLGQATPGMHAALQQILHCPYQGFTKRMFLESKVLELMTLILEQEIEVQEGKQPLVGLKPDDIDRLYWAKEVLQQNLDQPLSLMQLARQVGLNECTLKQGFRQLFGMTVFGYLRQCRMKQARLLLLEGRMNVREAALAVGYTSQSRFASVFRKTFGMNPKQFSNQRSH
ncbi:transcriptional regulator, AraC family [Gloeocapsa sp. PCC 7428]|uniref:helix-turn-helix transcriptional regulator n=1 Tax=Gloeocapsa sp. PCC 7428 TaxID=1173026 RepID=UPI0002A607C6|nr:AraC family transcriptional regulator [Gloeocapsa sp. PCC 7428]AFZ29173.1 transcriptional regulator, AraC family [Gloeocapsa sp. PCC 7428]